MSETVYVLTREYDHEGESAVGVFATLEGAQAAGSAWMADRDEPSGDWWEEREGEWALGNFPRMIVRREEVKP